MILCLTLVTDRRSRKEIVETVALTMKSLLISTNEQEKLIQNETERRRTLRLLQVSFNCSITSVIDPLLWFLDASN